MVLGGLPGLVEWTDKVDGGSAGLVGTLEGRKGGGLYRSRIGNSKTKTGQHKILTLFTENRPIPYTCDLIYPAD